MASNHSGDTVDDWSGYRGHYRLSGYPLCRELLNTFSVFSTPVVSSAEGFNRAERQNGAEVTALDPAIGDRVGTTVVHTADESISGREGGSAAILSGADLHPRPMPGPDVRRWEYKTLRPARDETRKEAKDPQESLNALGDDGWEFAGTIDYTGGGTKYIVFKRPADTGLGPDDGETP